MKNRFSDNSLDELQGDEELVALAHVLSAEAGGQGKCPPAFRRDLKERLLSRAYVLSGERQERRGSFAVVLRRLFTPAFAGFFSLLVLAVGGWFTFLRAPQASVGEYGKLPRVVAEDRDFTPSTSLELVDSFSFPHSEEYVPVFKGSRVALSRQDADSIATSLGFSSQEQVRVSDVQQGAGVEDNTLLEWVDDEGERQLEIVFEQGESSLSYVAFGEREVPVAPEALQRFQSFVRSYTQKLQGESVVSEGSGIEQQALEAALLFMTSYSGEAVDESAYTSYVVPSTDLNVPRFADLLPEYYYVVYLHQTVDGVPLLYRGQEHPLQSALTFYITLQGDVAGFVYDDFLVSVDTAQQSLYPLMSAEEAFASVREGAGHLLYLAFSSEEPDVVTGVPSTRYFFQPSEHLSLVDPTVDAISLRYLKYTEGDEVFFLPVYTLAGQARLPSATLLGGEVRFLVLLPNSIDAAFTAAPADIDVALPPVLPEGSFSLSSIPENVTTMTEELVLVAEDITDRQGTPAPYGVTCIFGITDASGQVEEVRAPVIAGRAEVRLTGRDTVSAIRTVSARIAESDAESAELTFAPAQQYTPTMVASGVQVSLVGSMVAVDGETFALEHADGLTTVYFAPNSVIVGGNGGVLTLQELSVLALPQVVQVLAKSDGDRLLADKVVLPMQEGTRLVTPTRIVEKGTSTQVAASTPTIAQQQTQVLRQVRVEGVVRDQSGELLSRAQVSLLDPVAGDKVLAQTLTSGDAGSLGQFIVQKHVQEREYVVSVSKDGYEGRQIVVDASLGDSIRVEVVLQERYVYFEVEVSRLHQGTKTVYFLLDGQEVPLALSGVTFFRRVDDGSAIEVPFSELAPGTRLVFKGHLGEGGGFVVGDKRVEVKQ